MAAFDAIDERLKASAEADRFAGAVLVKVGADVLMEGGYNLADRERRIPNTPDTRFRIASAGKMFTAVAVLRLVQEGVLMLGTAVGDLLPAYPDPATRAVTVHQLLTHSGGLGDFWGELFEQHRAGLRSPADYIALFGHIPPVAPPAVGFRYSSLGYVLLGRMMELATGEDFHALMARLVFAPAAMNATGSPPEREAIPDRAFAYRWERDAWSNAAATLPWRGTPAGGGLSTVGDLARFAAALGDDRLLDASHRALLLRRHVAVPSGGWYGYGFQLGLHGGTPTVGHGGASQGMGAAFTLLPERDAVTIVLSNRGGPAVERVATTILDALTSP